MLRGLRSVFLPLHYYAIHLILFSARTVVLGQMIDAKRMPRSCARLVTSECQTSVSLYFTRSIDQRIVAAVLRRQRQTVLGLFDTSGE
jgi:hypothetical protein